MSREPHPTGWKNDSHGDTETRRSWEAGPRNDLALAYLNRGVAHELAENLPGAVLDWGLGIGLLAEILDRGWHAAGVPLLRGLSWCFSGCRDLGDWPGAAKALLGSLRAVEQLQSVWQAAPGEGEPPWMGEIAPLAAAARGLDPEQRAALLAALGEDAGMVRQGFGW